MEGLIFGILREVVQFGGSLSSSNSLETRLLCGTNVSVRFFFGDVPIFFPFSLRQLSRPHLCLANAKSSAGLLEMPDIRSAMEALTLTNHFTINPPGNERTYFFLLLSHS